MQKSLDSPRRGTPGVVDPYYMFPALSTLSSQFQRRCCSTEPNPNWRNARENMEQIQIDQVIPAPDSWTPPQYQTTLADSFEVNGPATYKKGKPFHTRFRADGRDGGMVDQPFGPNGTATDQGLHRQRLECTAQHRPSKRLPAQLPPHDGAYHRPQAGTGGR
jgi:hypothetical protein